MVNKEDMHPHHRAQLQKLEDTIFDSILSPMWDADDKRRFAEATAESLMYRQDCRRYSRRRYGRRRRER